MEITKTPMNDLEIANTFFDNVEDRSQFLKDVEYNMKVDAGIDTGVSNEQLTNEYNKNVEQTIDKATEDTLLNLNDPSQIGMVTSMFEAQYVANKADPEMTVQRMYTDKNIEEKLNNDGVYRVNYANSKRDASIWVTRYIYGLQQIADMYEHNSWDWHDAKRMLGPLALAGGTSLLKKSISSANPVGAFAGGVIGGIGYGGPLLWDYIALGDSSFNVQRDVNNRFYDIVSNSKDFVKDIERLKADIQKYPKEYRGDIAKALTEGPDTFADSGNEMTGLGLATSMKFVAPAFNGAKAFSKKLFNKSLGKKSFQWNDKLADTIKQTITNSVDKEAIEARVDEHVTNTAPKDADDTTKETVKGIELNNENDRLLTANNTDDRVFAKPVNDNIPADEMLTPANDNESIFIEDPLVLREQPQPEPLFNNGARNLPGTANDNTRELMAGEPMAVTSERPAPDVNKRRQRALEAEWKSQRGEINLSGKDLKEEVIIRHGRGVNNEPMTYEEAVETMKKKQGRQKAVDYDETDFQSLEVDENAPDFIALEAATKTAWGKDITDPGMADYSFAGTGEGGQYYIGGLYTSVADLKHIAARYQYWNQFTNTLARTRGSRDPGKIAKSIYRYGYVENKYINKPLTFGKVVDRLESEYNLKDIKKDLANYYEMTNEYVFGADQLREKLKETPSASTIDNQVFEAAVLNDNKFIDDYINDEKYLLDVAIKDYKEENTSVVKKGSAATMVVTKLSNIETMENFKDLLKNNNRFADYIKTALESDIDFKDVVKNSFESMNIPDKVADLLNINNTPTISKKIIVKGVIDFGANKFKNVLQHNREYPMETGFVNRLDIDNNFNESYKDSIFHYLLNGEEYVENRMKYLTENIQKNLDAFDSSYRVWSGLKEKLGLTDKASYNKFMKDYNDSVLKTGSTEYSYDERSLYSYGGQLEFFSYNAFDNAQEIAILNELKELDKKDALKLLKADNTNKIKSDTALLNTLSVENPEKSLDGYLHWSSNKGLVPLASFYKGDKARAAQASTYNKLKSIYKDVADNFSKDVDLYDVAYKDFNLYQHVLKYIHDDIDLSTPEKVRKFVEDANPRDQLRAFELLERAYLYNDSGNFRSWQKNYMKSKGFKALNHKGSGSTGNNFAIMDESILQPVNKVYTRAYENDEGMETYAYDNAHWIEEAGDGAGYYVMERHAPQGSMPVILRDNKRVDNKK